LAPLSSDEPSGLLGVAELDTLDGAIEMLGALQGERGTRRRGRIDVAALLYALAPQARIEIAPGEGTEVFGEEGALSRMLHVLLHQAVGDGPLASASPEIRVERQGDVIRVGVELGPDTSASSELERRWLAHMATRFGGRIELGGGRQTLLLPADGVDDKSEVVALRRELQEAQALGETYAMELATVLTAVQSRTEEHGAPPSSRADLSFSISTELAVALARATSHVYEEWLQTLHERVEQAARALGPTELTRALLEHTASGASLLSDVAAFGDISSEEATSLVSLTVVGRDLIEALADHAARNEVVLEVRVPSDLDVTAPPRALAVLVRAMASCAIEETPAHGSVVLTARRLGTDIELTVSGGGQQLPTTPVGSQHLSQNEATQVGRPLSVSLVVARATAVRLGGSFGMRASSSGTELWARIRSI
jgi:hypothetical protein